MFGEDQEETRSYPEEYFIEDLALLIAQGLSGRAPKQPDEDVKHLAEVFGTIILNPNLRSIVDTYYVYHKEASRLSDLK